jgi:hypothetical protein
MKQSGRRNYTVINHDARVSFDISITEYCIFDLIHHLATHPKNNKNGWCYAKKETIASYFALNRATVFRAIKKGLAQGLLEKHPKQPALLRATRSWYTTVQMKQTTPSRILRRDPSSQDAIPSRRKMRWNKDREKENGNFGAGETQKNTQGIGVLLSEYQFPNEDALLSTEWQVEAKRLWLALGLVGEPSRQFLKHIKIAYTNNQQGKLARVISYCQDAKGIRDPEKFFYWRYAHDP